MSNGAGVVGKLVKKVLVTVALTALGLTVLAAFTIGPLFTAAFIGKLFVAAGVALISDVFAPKAPEIRQDGLKIEVSSPIDPLTIIYGRASISGTSLAVFTTGRTNKFLHILSSWPPP